MDAVKPIRVFHLVKGLGRGGAEMLLAEGPAHSRPDEFEYAFGYFVPWKDALVPEVRRAGPVLCFDAEGPGRLLASVPRVARAVRSFGADILHCHMPLASVAGRLAGRLAGVPVISTEHNVLERYHPATRVATLATWRLQRHVIAVSREVSRSIERHSAGVPVTVIANGVSVERFSAGGSREQARRALGLPPGGPVVGTVAVFRSQKRLDLWLEAASAIASVIPEVRFVIVGDGPLRAGVEEGVAGRGLAGRVLLPGLTRDVRPFLAAMDVFMVSSDFEGLPVALLEAMASGAIPVTTDAGGIPEVVTAGTGVVVRRGDPEALARAVVSVLGSAPSTRALMSRAAESRIRAEFSVETMIRRTEALYREVLGRG